MDLNSIKSRNDIPDELPVVQNLLWNSVLQIVKLQDQIKTLRKEAFGPSSEKLKDDIQTIMPGLLEQIPEIIAAIPIEYVEVTASKRRKNHPGRNVIPDNIKTEKHILDVCEDIKNCVDCDKKETCKYTELPQFDEVVRTVIERKKAEYVKHVYVRIKRACPIKKNTVHVAEPPLVTPIEKGMAGLQLLLFVIISKYRYHLPLYRVQRQIFHESQIWFSRATMVGWIAEICNLLKPVYLAMVETVKKSSIIWTDDTLVRRVTKAGRHTSYMWVYLGMLGRNVVFDYQETRGSDAPRKFLKGVSAGTYLMSDALASYNDAIARYELIAMACWMHIRRKFIETFETGRHKEFSAKILLFIGQFYRLERFATKRKMDDQQRLELRTRYSAPIIARIKDMLLNHNLPLLPECKVGKAVKYALGLWNEATVFLTRGDLPLDNGPSERAVRDLVIGRNNWLHVGSDEGGKRMAILMSIMGTCKVNGIDPEEYLSDILLKLAIRAPNQSVVDLTPIEWVKSKNGGVLPPIAGPYPKN